MTMLRAFIASLVGAVTAVAAMGAGGGQPGSAFPCQRAVAIDPQMTVSEGGGTLIFTVRTNSCAQAGSVFYRVFDGSAQRPNDFMLENGRLDWAAGDVSYRHIKASINGDREIEPSLEEFTVVLFSGSDTVRIASAESSGRIFDDDTQLHSAVVDNTICLISGETSCVPAPPREPGIFLGPIGTNTLENGNTAVPIELNQANAFDTTVLFNTQSGGLIEGVDFVGVHQPVLIPAGETVVYVIVQFTASAFSKPGQSLYTQVSNYGAGTIVDGNGVVTMLG